VPATSKVFALPYEPDINPLPADLTPEPLEDPVDEAPDVDPDPFAGAFTDGFENAPGEKSPRCPSSDTPYDVHGWPSSPMRLYPFQDEYVDPAPKQFFKAQGCRRDGKCMKAAEIDIVEVRGREAGVLLAGVSCGCGVVSGRL
jgi:hypothetical protein